MRNRYVSATLVVVVAGLAAGALRSIQPDVSAVCYPPYGDANCSETHRSAWIDLTAIVVVLAGLAGAAAIVASRSRRIQSWKSLARLYAVCLGITVVLYAGLVLVVLVLA